MGIMDETVAHARSGMYRLLSIAFAYPGEELRNLKDSLIPHGFVENAGKLKGYRLKSLAGSVKKIMETYGNHGFNRLESEYMDLFGPEKNDGCNPYEVGYLEGPLFMNTRELADIAGFYRAFGLEVSEKNKERVDHISAELEFMYALTLKEAYAIVKGRLEELEICRDAQRKFLTDHLGRWTGSFRDEIQEKKGSMLYVKLGSLLDRFVKAEVKRLGAKPQHIKPSSEKSVVKSFS